MFEAARIFIIFMPLGFYITWGLFLLVIYFMKTREVHKLLWQILSVYIFSAILSCFLFFMFYYEPDIFAQFDTLYYAAVIYTMVSFHHFICFAVQSSEPFNKLHYIIPALICILMFCIKLTLSNVWMQSGGNSISLSIALLWGIVYLLLSIHEVQSYQVKQSIISSNWQAIDKRKTVLLLGEAFLYLVIFVVFPLNWGGEPTIFISFLLTVSILLAATLSIPTVYAIINHYTSDMQKNSFLALAFVDVDIEQKGVVIIESKQMEDLVFPKRKHNKYTSKRHTKGKPIEWDKEMFNHYFRHHKPYLNPNLKITDVSEHLQSNRTYVSNSINLMYGMGFSSYINLCRLNEMNQLLEIPLNKDKSTTELARMAGFGTYQKYLRTKKRFMGTKDLSIDIKPDL